MPAPTTTTCLGGVCEGELADVKSLIDSVYESDIRPRNERPSHVLRSWPYIRSTLPIECWNWVGTAIFGGWRPDTRSVIGMSNSNCPSPDLL
jgi:hypothetical protein